jgi:hypothetical protein
MLELPVRDGPVEPFFLEPDTRAERGIQDTASRSLEGAAIAISEPMVIALAEKLVANDPELAAFWDAEKARYYYHYISFCCTLEPKANVAFEWARVAIQLAPSPGPVVYSMAPGPTADIMKVKESATLGTDFKILSAKSNDETEREVKDWMIRPYRQGFTNPYWEMRSTASTDLAGDFRMHLITRTPVGIVANGNIRGRAKIKGGLIVRLARWISGRTESTEAIVTFNLNPG